MRIGFFTDTYFPRVDGVVFSIDTFRRELEALGHEVYIFAPRPNLRYREKDDHIIRFTGIKNRELDYTLKAPWTPQAFWKARKLELDIVHIHTPFELGTFGIALALREKIPLVNTYHTDILEYARHYPQMLPGALALVQVLPVILGQPQLFKSSLRAMKPERTLEQWSQKVVTRFMPLMNNLCDRIIAPSLKVKEQLTAMGTTKPITVLPTGVDKITTNSSEVTAWHTRYGLNRQSKIILYVGRLAPEKNLETLIEAFALITPQDPTAKLLIVGDGSHKKTLESMAFSMGISDRVIFTGYITDRNTLGAAYEISRVFAFPSHTDTQGLVIHEAAAAGLPTVMTDHGITEVIINSKSGLYAQNNPTDFASKLISVLQDDQLYHQLSKTGIELAAKYTARQQGLKIEAIYQELIQESIETLRAKTSHTL
jgi:1,2-diacylglycerol 3-alpha-glucosyltransferase